MTKEGPLLSSFRASARAIAGLSQPDFLRLFHFPSSTLRAGQKAVKSPASRDRATGLVAGSNPARGTNSIQHDPLIVPGTARQQPQPA